ncbi:Uroporphyrinogen-III synthase [Candida viswanathii]|uniref:Uroporphyrinogen-III synthase n=1 Tax=Candida viswanathii TaxID=5486 RepID=A0A367XMX3_9ASCO|nr:Uroporphyrinogen-III synthase [Candida viswanathii]
MSNSSNNVILLKNPSVPEDPYDAKFTTSHYAPHFIPLLTHTHTNKHLTTAYLSSTEFLDHCDVFIITSQRAVEMFHECLCRIPAATRARIYAKVGYTVGPATYSILKGCGFVDVRGGERAGNGSKLADLISGEITREARVVFFTGEIRKDIIPKKLCGLGYDLKEVVIYKTECREDIVERFERLMMGLELGWIVFFSPQGTKEIVEHLRRESGGRRWKIASIGPTTEEYLLGYDIKPNVIAEKPEPESLFQCIYKYDTTK